MAFVEHSQAAESVNGNRKRDGWSVARCNAEIGRRWYQPKWQRETNPFTIIHRPRLLIPAGTLEYAQSANEPTKIRMKTKATSRALFVRGLIILQLVNSFHSPSLRLSSSAAFFGANSLFPTHCAAAYSFPLVPSLFYSQYLWLIFNFIVCGEDGTRNRDRNCVFSLALSVLLGSGRWPGVK